MPVTVRIPESYSQQVILCNGDLFGALFIESSAPSVTATVAGSR